MALTGRTRDIAITLIAEEKRQGEGNRGWVELGAWGAALGYSAISVDLKETFITGFFGSPDECTFTVDIRMWANVSAGGAGVNLYGDYASFGPYTVPAGYWWPFFSLDYGIGHVDIFSAEVTYTMSGSYTLVEDYTGLIVNHPTSTIIESFTTRSASCLVAGSMEINHRGGPHGTLGINTSASCPLANFTWDITTPHHSMVFRSGVSTGSIRGRIIVSGPGVSYSAPSVAGSNGSVSLSGTTIDATYSNGGAAANAQATVQGSPDWGYSFTGHIYDYETGNRINGAQVRHQWGASGTPLEVSTFNYDTPYAFGPTRAAIATIYNGTSTATVVNQPYWIHNCKTDGTTGSAGSYFIVDEDWADAQGIMFGADTYQRNNQAFEFDYSADYDLATVEIDDTHRYRFSTDATKWFPAATQDGSAVRFTPGSYMPYNGSTEIYFKPYAYRYHRIRLKSNTANTTISLSVSYNIASNSNGTTNTWTFTCANADTWYTFEFDLAYPPSAAGYFSTVQYYPIGDYYLYDSFNVLIAAGARLRIGVPSGVVWVEYLEGFHKSDGNRIPVLWIAPIQGRMMHASDLDYLAMYAIGGPVYGQMVVNGARSLNLANSWTANKSGFDDSTGDNDTGIHIIPTNPTPYWATQANPNTSQQLFNDHKSWRSMTLDTPMTIKGVMRLPLCGYYGFGNPRTGAYGAAIDCYGTKVTNGEVIGQLYSQKAPNPNVPIALHDDNTGTLLESTTSDLDGMYRLFHKQGHNTPTSNHRVNGYSGLFPNYVYTAQGLLMNAYWIKTKGASRVDSEGYVEEPPFASFPAYRKRFEIMDRSPNFHDLQAFNSNTVCLWETAFGELHSARPCQGKILYSYSQHPITPFSSTNVQVTDGSLNDSHPRMVVNSEEQVIYLLFARNLGTVGIYEAVSRDNGKTWSTPTLAFANGQYPEIAIAEGEIIRAAFIPAGNLIKGTVQYPGEINPSAEFTFKDNTNTDMLFEPYGFSIKQEKVGSTRWILGCVIKTETDVSYWISSDNCKTWKRL
jgi:hypothetical protein